MNNKFYIFLEIVFPIVKIVIDSNSKAKYLNFLESGFFIGDKGFFLTANLETINTRIDLSELKAGTYSLQIETENCIFTKKLLLNKYKNIKMDTLQIQITEKSKARYFIDMLLQLDYINIVRTPEFTEMIENLGLANAIDEGKNSGKANRDEIMDILQGNHL